MAVQINVAANQAALVASIQAGVQAYNQRFANNNQINLNINARAFSQPLGRITGDVKDITLRMFREFYQFMWMNRSYWEPRLKNA